jgi:hypothetical protein
MKKISPRLLGLSLAACSLAAVAQERPWTTPVPPVLVISREIVKPGKAGMIHDKSESAFVQAFSRAKWPTHYIALNSLSGQSRALYLTGYLSFDAFEKDYAAMEKNAALAAELERAGVADGDLLTSLEQRVYTWDEELSYKPNGDLLHTHFFEVAVYHVRPGHGKDFSDLMKAYIALNDKANTSANWAMFRLEYGGNAGTYVALSKDKSLADIDKGMAEDKQIGAGMTDEDKNHIRELRAAALESEEDELFAINPKQSYVWDSFKEDEFWKPMAAKPAAAEKKAPAAAKPTP